MGVIDSKLSEYFFSPFRDDNETIEIKKFAKRVAKLPDFKNLNLHIVQYNDIETIHGKLKLVPFCEQFRRKAVALYYGITMPTSYGLHYDNMILILIDNRIKDTTFSIDVNLQKMKIQVKKYTNKVDIICCDILSTMYHEKRHRIQNTTHDNTFASIICQIESVLRLTMYGEYKYNKSYDQWYLELDADKYGFDKTIEYFKNNPLDNHVNQIYLSGNKMIADLLTRAYNFDGFFTLYNIYREILPFFIRYNNTQSNFFSCYKDMNWHKVLYGDKKRLKSVEEILNDPLLNKIDPKFINYVLTSQYLHRNINYGILSDIVLKRLYIEFQKRLDETEALVNDIVEHVFGDNDKSFHDILKRLKRNIICYQSRMQLIANELTSRSCEVGLGTRHSTKR